MRSIGLFFSLMAAGLASTLPQALSSGFVVVFSMAIAMWLVAAAASALRGGRYVHLVGTGRICRLNATAAAVMDACGGGTPGDAVAALADRHPAVELERLRTDVLAATRWLAARGLRRRTSVSMA